jgi:hypothetical protein
MKLRSLYVLFVLLLLQLHAQAQNRGTVEMRNQLAPIQQEQIEALRYDMSTNTSEAGPPMSLAVSVQSISPISKAGTVTVELLIENTGNAVFRLPISREAKLLHYEPNQDRRVFSCDIELINERSPNEQIITGGLSTYSASMEPSSTFELRRRESLTVRFEANISSAWNIRKDWKDRIAHGTALGGVSCYQTGLKLPPNSVPDPKKKLYSLSFSERIRSTNSVPLSFAP